MFVAINCAVNATRWHISTHIKMTSTFSTILSIRETNVSWQNNVRQMLYLCFF